MLTSFKKIILYSLILFNSIYSIFGQQLELSTNFEYRTEEKNKDWTIFYNQCSKIFKDLRKKKKYQKGLDSISRWISIVPTGEDKVLGKLYYYKGDFERRIGLIYSCIESYKKAVYYFKRVNQEKNIFFSYRNISTNYSRIHDYKSSRTFAFLALDNFPDVPEWLSKKKNLSLHIVETYMWEGNMEKALETLLEYNRLNGPMDNEGLALLAKLYTLNNELEKANMVINPLLENTNIESLHLGVLETTKLLEEQQGNLSKAITYQKEICDKTPRKTTDREFYREQVKLSQLLFDNREYYSSEQIVDKVLSYYDIDIHSTKKSKTTSKTDIWTANALYLKARILLEKDRETDHVRFEEALLYAKAAVEIVRIQKQFVISNEEKYRFGELERQYSQLVLELLIKKWKETKEIKYFDRGFVLSQSSSAGVLKESLQAYETLEFCDIPDSLTNRWLISKEQLANSPSDTITEIIIRHDSLENEIRKICPAYDHVLHYPIVHVSDIQRKLDKYDYLLKYQKIEDNYYVFVIGCDTLIWDLIEEGKRIDNSVDQIFDILSEDSGDGHDERKFIDHSRFLYKAIVEPFIPKEEWKEDRKLYLVSDGSLRKLPFDALLSREASSWIDSDTYLINDFNISNFYYCSQFIEDNKLETVKQTFSGFGANYSNGYFVNFANSENLDLEFINPLENAVIEVSEICSLVEGNLFAEEEVTKENIEKELLKSQVVHLSTHAFINTNNMISSGILVYPGPSKQEYTLSYLDILQTKYDTELIVLSACQSLNGKIYESEGLLSLARAFTQAGVKSVVGNLWNTSDNMAPELMKIFYKNLKKGFSADRALRTAKLEYLSNEDINTPAMRSPHYWAGWKIYGSSTPWDSFSLVKVFKKYVPAFVLVLFLTYLLKRKFSRRSK